MSQVIEDTLRQDNGNPQRRVVRKRLSLPLGPTSVAHRSLVGNAYRRYSRRTADRYIFSGSQRRNFTM